MHPDQHGGLHECVACFFVGASERKDEQALRSVPENGDCGEEEAQDIRLGLQLEGGPGAGDLGIVQEAQA